MIGVAGGPQLPFKLHGVQGRRARFQINHSAVSIKGKLTAKSVSGIQCRSSRCIHESALMIFMIPLCPGSKGAALSLRLQINFIIAVMMMLFIGTLVYQQVEDTRSSVREETEGSNRVAIQLLTAVSGAYEESGVRGMVNFPAPAGSDPRQRRLAV